MPERVRALESAAVDRSGVLVASGWNFVAFSFAVDDDRSAVAFARDALGSVEPEERPWSIGMAVGDLELLAEDGSHGELAWGRALVAAGILADAASPGDVLCTEAVVTLLPTSCVVIERHVARSSGDAIVGLRIETSADDARRAGDVDASERPSGSMLSGRREPPSTDVASDDASQVGRVSEIFASLSPSPGWIERSAFTERMRVLSRLGRGDIDDALRVLRRARADLDTKDHAQRCQASLAIGVALSVAGRPQEALLEGMDALARARHGGDERGANACLAFLAKLFGSVGRTELVRP